LLSLADPEEDLPDDAGAALPEDLAGLAAALPLAEDLAAASVTCGKSSSIAGSRMAAVNQRAEPASLDFMAAYPTRNFLAGQAPLLGICAFRPVRPRPT
jgi:hypothetical protein